MNATRVCDMPECGRKHEAHGLCKNHYEQGLRSGKVVATQGRETLEAKFENRVSRSTGCWEWTGAIGPNGYGRMTHKKDGRYVKLYAHRVSYEMHKGAIPDELVIDHLCRNRKCVNPDHLEPVSNRENILRGTSPIANAARATHCPAGHSYSGENLYVTRNGHRCCRKCTREKRRAAWAMKGDLHSCAGITRLGSRCKHKVRARDYCGQHGRWSI